MNSNIQSRTRTIFYWVTTILVTAELVLGGIWDIMKIPLVTKIIIQLGYPSYFLIMLGILKELGAIALLIPRFPRLKEWAYAGTFFNYIGAITSLIITGSGFINIVYPVIQTGLTIASWSLRPSSRRDLVSKTGFPKI